MRKLILLFLSLIISVPTFAAVTDEECHSKNKSECGKTAGCGWIPGWTQGDCKACQKDEYSISVVSTNNNELACKKCSDITEYTNPDTGEVITYGSNYYKYTLGAGRTITDCYANCELMAQELSKNNGKWISTGPATAYYPNKCKFACYTSDNGYNICNSYYHPWNFQTQKPDTTVCQPSWLFMNSPTDIQNNPYKPSNGQSYTDFCQNAKTGIYMLLQSSGTEVTCSAQSCQDGYHLESVQDIVDAESPTGDTDKYYCQSDTLNIPNEEMFQICESNIRKCSNYFGASCKVTIDGTEYTDGTVGGNAEWNGNNAYLTDKCTCTVSTSVTEGKYEHVCKRSTTSNTWDGANCETTIETCNSGFCVVGYDATNKTQRCAAAPRGYYSDGRDVKECGKCPAGKTTEKIRSTNKDACSYSRETEFCDSVGCFNLNYTSLQQK